MVFFFVFFFFKQKTAFEMRISDGSSDVCSSALVMSSPHKSNSPNSFHDHARQRRRGVYWVTPAVVLILYLCVMGAFFWLQRLHDDSVMFVTIDQEVRQQRLIWVVLELSCVILISLLMLWRYTRFRSSPDAALFADPGCRRAMTTSTSTC